MLLGFFLVTIITTTKRNLKIKEETKVTSYLRKPFADQVKRKTVQLYSAGERYVVIVGESSFGMLPSFAEKVFHTQKKPTTGSGNNIKK